MADTDRNLLFGVLAMQLDLIDPRQFADACAGWAVVKDKPLADILIERGWITMDDRRDVERFLERKLERHGGDARASLAAAADPAARDAIRSVDDSEVRNSLTSLPPAAGYVLVETVIRPKEQRSRYRLTRLHAQGGLGRVWVAHDSDLNRDVALKEIRPEEAGHPEAWRRFLKEAQVTGQLEHPGIVPVYELAHRLEDDQPFYTMRFVKGGTLRQAIADHHARPAALKADPLDRFKLLQAFVAVCQAVGYAHSRGVIHRDLKPENVVLDDYGVVMVLDWGLARMVDRPDEDVEVLPGVAVSDEAKAEATRANALLGTPAYMAPEQAEGRNDLVDVRTDVYGLGAILFEILTGRPPYQNADIAEVLRRASEGETPRARQIEASVPPALDAVCARAMARSRADRYGSAAELAEDAQRWLVDEPVSAYNEGLTRRAARWARRHKTTVMVAIVVGLVVPPALAAVVIIRKQRDAALAERKQAVAESDLAHQQARSAEQLKKLADQNSRIAQYFNLIAQPNEVDRGKPGWTWDRASKLNEAARLDFPQRDVTQLRSEVVDCLSTADLHVSSVPSQSLLALEPAVPLVSKEIPTASCLCFSPDGRFLAIAQAKTTSVVRFQVRLVDLKTNSARQLWVQPVPSLKEPNEGGRSIAFTPGNKGLVLRTRYGWIHHWDFSQPEPKRTSWDSREREITGFAISPDVKWVFTSSRDRILKRWDLTKPGQGNTPFFESLKLEFAVSDLKVTPDGGMLICATDGGIQVIDSASLKPIRAHAFPGVDHLASTRDGRTLAASMYAGDGTEMTRVMLFDLERGEEIRSLQDPGVLRGGTHRASNLDMDFSPDGSLLATGSKAEEDHIIKLWDVASGRLLIRLMLNGSLNHTRFSPDGRTLAVATTGGVTLYNLGGVELRTTVACQPRPISAIALDARTQTLVCASEPRSQSGRACDPELTYWNAVTWRRKRNDPVPRRSPADSCTSLAFNRDGTFLASAWHDSDRIMLFDASKDGSPTTIKVERPRAVGFSPDGTRLWSAAGEKVRGWSISDFKELPEWTNLAAKIFRGRDRITSLAATNSWVLAGGRDGFVFVFRTSEFPQLKESWACSDQPVTSLALNAAETIAAVGTENGILTLRRIPSGKPIDERRIVQSGAIAALAFSDDGRFLVSGAQDLSIRLWRVIDDSMVELLTLRSPTGPIHSARFTPDGQRLFTVANGDAAVRVWHLDVMQRTLKPLGLDWE